MEYPTWSNLSESTSHTVVYFLHFCTHGNPTVLNTFKHNHINVYVYCLKSPSRSADFIIYVPGTGTLSYTVSSPLGRIQYLRTLLQL